MDSDEESYEYDDGSDPGDSIHMNIDNDELRCTKELETRELSREDEIALRKKLKEKDIELRASMSTEEKGTGAEKRRKINPKDELVSSAITCGCA